MKDILFFSGQSNMQGQTEKLLYGDPVAGCQEYRFLEDTLVPLKNPCGEDIRFDGTLGFPYPTQPDWHAQNALGATVFGFTSLLPRFCEAYREEAALQGDCPQVVAVHAAKGATCLDYWLPGTPAYDILLRKCNGALRQAGEVRKRFFIWLQGESDAIAGVSCDKYKEMLSAFGHALEEQLGIDRFGIIRVGRFTMNEQDDEIIRAQDEICREDSFFVMLTDVAADFCVKEEYAMYMNPQAAGHYSASGLCRLGELAGTSLAQYI